MKKLLSIVLAMLLMVSLLAACGGGETPASEAPAPEAPASEPEAEAPEADPADSSEPAAEGGKLANPMKIGLTLLMNDGLFADIYKYAQYMADNLGFELVVDIGAFSPEEQVASIENLIAAGVDGIVFTNFSEACLPKVATLCDEAQVWWVQPFRQIDDAETREAVEAAEYYVGRFHENNAMVADMVADAFKEKNVTKTAIIGPQTGDTTTDTIAARFKEKAAEYGMEVLTEVRNVDDAAGATAAVENIAANFPDVEGFCMLSGSTGKFEGLLEGLKNMNKLGEIYVGGNDASTTIEQDLASGDILCATGGQYTDAILATTALINYVNGNALTDAKINLDCNYLMFTTPEEAAMFNERMLNHDTQSYVYDAEELRQMIVEFNPSFTFADLEATATAYSFEDFEARHPA